MPSASDHGSPTGGPLPPPVPELPVLPPQQARMPAASPMLSTSAPPSMTLGETPQQENTRERRSGLGASIATICVLAAAAAVVIVGLRSTGEAEPDAAQSADAAPVGSLAPLPEPVDARQPDLAPTIDNTPAPPPTSVVAQFVDANGDPIDVEQHMADLAELRDRCRLEHGKVFASFQGFYLKTGAVPDDPDRLVASGWLEEHPDGWSDRWAIIYDDGAYYVVPQPGSLCDG